MINKEENKLPSEQLALFPESLVVIKKGKDEMNLAEFPIAAASHIIPKGKTELTFQDEITDKSTGEIITRSLTIESSLKRGLPTPVDDEIILALVNIWKQQGGTSQTVFFTSHQIIKTLGWSNQSSYYNRIKESLERWIAISLHYKNAWWSKQHQSWKNSSVNLISSVTWADKHGEASEMVWGDKVYNSLKAGNIKNLDLVKFRELKSATARRIYRLLDKRFYKKKNYSADLKAFACNKIGIASNYTTYQLKRQLLSAIMQLEEIGFIEPLEITERFTKVTRGQWKVHFQKAEKSKHHNIIKVTETNNFCDLSSALEDLGITQNQINSIVEEHPKELLEEWLEVIKFLSSHKTKETPKNPAGYLVKALKEKWPFPPDYRTIEQRKIAAQEEKAKLMKLADLKSAKKQNALCEADRIAAENQLAADQQRKVDDYMVVLSPLKRSKIKKSAFNAAKDQPFIEVKGTAGDIAREAAIVDYVLQILEY